MIAVTTIALTILMSACVLDVVVNKLNPTPKMKDEREEEKFSRTICKTRKMYEYVIR